MWACVCVCVCVCLCVCVCVCVCLYIEVYHACNSKVLNPCNNLYLYMLTLRVGHVHIMVELFKVL